MTNLLENIVNYYIDSIMENKQINRDKAILILEDTLQSENIEVEILDYSNSLNKENY